MLTCTTRDLATIYGCSVQYIGELIKSGALPTPVKQNCHNVLKACRAIVEILKSESDKSNSDIDAEKHRLVRARARLAEIEVLETQKLLVPAKEVTQAAFDSGRIVRDALLSIIPRTYAILAAQSDPLRVREILDKEIRQVLEHLSKDFEEKAK